MEGEIFLAFLIFGTMSTMVYRRIFDKCANYGERFVIRSGSIANFQGGKCTFAPIYLKISVMEGEIFCSFLILVSILQWCRGGFLLNVRIMERDIANFKVENVPLHQFISKSLRWRLKYFWHF